MVWVFEEIDAREMLLGDNKMLHRGSGTGKCCTEGVQKAISV